MSDVYWRSFGQGPEAALLLHCGLAHSGAWRGVAAALGRRLTMRAPDMPGHGRSAPWDGVRNVHDLSFESALGGLDAPAHVIGHSFGATVALRLALEHPDRVRSLVLIEPVFFAAAQSGLGAYRAQLAPLGGAFAEQRWGDAAQHFTAIWGDGTPWETLPEPVRAAMTGQMPIIHNTDASLFDDIHGLLRPGGLEQLSIPVLMLRGDQSPKIIPAIHDGLMQRLPKVSEVVLEGAGHLSVMTHPAHVARAIATHLDQDF